jgi:hypothetical protein
LRLFSQIRLVQLLHKGREIEEFLSKSKKEKSNKKIRKITKKIMKNNELVLL